MDVRFCNAYHDVSRLATSSGLRKGIMLSEIRVGNSLDLRNVLIIH